MIEAIFPALRMTAGGFACAIATPTMGAGGPRSVGPFVNVRHTLPVSLAPGALPLSDDVRPHPHIGMCAVSYLFEGAMTHRDSLGETREVLAGDVSWMAAGRGVVHSERYERLRREGGRMHGLQIWVALPEGREDEAPSYRYMPGEDAPALAFEGGQGRLLLGAAHGRASPIPAHSPLYLEELTVDEGAVVPVPSAYEERAVYVIAGSLYCEGRIVEAGQTVRFTPGADVRITAATAAQLLSYGGDPIGPRYVWWNFVSSSLERIEAAKADWRCGRFALPPDDRSDFPALPADHERPLMRLNAG